MRNDPNGINIGFVIPALMMASLIFYNASAHAAEITPSNSLVKTIPLPAMKEAPKANLNWSETRAPRQQATLSQLRSKLKAADEYAALYAIQTALSQVGDGQTYIWGRPKRQLRTLVTPVNSFRSDNGQICRKILVSISLGNFMKRATTTACRAADRSWRIES